MCASVPSDSETMAQISEWNDEFGSGSGSRKKDSTDTTVHILHVAELEYRETAASVQLLYTCQTGMSSQVAIPDPE